MLNQVVLVGRLTADPQVVKSENKKKRTTVNLAVNRSYKNIDGIYETDFIRCILWDGIATNAAEYCKKGDVIGIKGRIQTTSYENDEGKKVYSMEVIAEKISFITTKHSEDTIEKVE